MPRISRIWALNPWTRQVQNHRLSLALALVNPRKITSGELFLTFSPFFYMHEAKQLRC